MSCTAGSVLAAAYEPPAAASASLCGADLGSCSCGWRSTPSTSAAVSLPSRSASRRAKLSLNSA
eukprot:scaffold21991_cov33-Tisochrysis_lutea.AAC.6